MPAMCENSIFFFKAGLRIQPEKKIDMPIKNVRLKIWLPGPFLSPVDTLSKENMVGLSPPPLPVFHFQLKLNINSNATWILAKSNPCPPPFLRFKEKNLDLHIQTFW